MAGNLFHARQTEIAALPVDTSQIWNYPRLKKMLEGQRLPAMIVELDAFDYNTDQLIARAQSKNKKLRIASKSVRVPALLQRIVDRGSAAVSGIMTYSAFEMEFLAKLGFDHFLQAYPLSQEVEWGIFRELTENGNNCCLMVDSPAQIRHLSEHWSHCQKKNPSLSPLKVCLDVDMSYRPLGGLFHLGVYRSPVRLIQDFSALCQRICETKELLLSGVMGYEAQIAGLAEQNPFSPLLNPVKKLIKILSVKDVYKKRATISNFFATRNITLEIFNGGGTGSLSTTCNEPWITEVTAGSGFLQSHLFDYYLGNRSLPAFAFALPITRFPQRGIVTCQSGGFIASGETGCDKAPLPFLPEGIKPISTEGFGEVQTPLRVPIQLWETLRLGDPIFFRPAKAGEIAERFAHYLLARGDRIVETVPTYRGLGKCFY